MFLISDTSIHPQYLNVYSLFQESGCQTKDLRFTPNTSVLELPIRRFDHN